MAGGRAGKEQKQQQNRVGPSVDADVAGRASRVSRAAGSLSASNMRSDQRGKASGGKASGSSGRGVSVSSSKGGSSGRGAGGTRGAQGAQGGQNGKASRSKGRASGSSSNPAPVPKTQDARFIDWMRGVWNGMEPHHQQRFLGSLLLLLSLFLFATLTVFRSVLLLSRIAGFFTDLFGWSAYLLALGLIAFSIVHLTEGIRNRSIIRWSLVLGLVVLWLIVLAESGLLLGAKRSGLVAQLLIAPLSNLPPAAQHMLLIGLFILVSIVAFRITFGHILLVGRFFRGAMTGGKSGQAASAVRPSPYLGQRPQYSRYGTGLATPAAQGQGQEAAGTPGRRQGRGQAPPAVEEDEGEEPLIEFESDFDGVDDPDNDINLHQHELGLGPRGGRNVAPLNRSEHSAAVQGAQQPPLPFGAPSMPAQDNKNARKAGGRNKADIMAPLQPNPAQKGKSVVDSPWQIPETSILNNPEEVKLQMFGDDTTALAKIIQDTLRSFRVEAEVRPEDISIGPTVIRFGIRPTGKPEMRQDAQGRYVAARDASGNIIYETRTRVSRIMALQNDLALVLEAKSIRMEAPVPGRPYVGVEIPNKNSRLVTLREVLESKEYQAAKAKSKLAVVLGKDVAGAVRVGDLARMPHLLIAGATGAGKCLAFDEPVFLADGRVVKAQELIGQSVEVIGITDTESMQQIPVLATFTDNGVQEVFEIELDNGIILRRTGEHPLWAAHLNENQHVGRQPDGKAARRIRAINADWVPAKDLRVCGNRPHFDGHVLLCPLALQQRGTLSHSDADVILCAVLLAEGSLNHYDYLTYNRTPRFSNADALMVDLVAEAAKEYDCKLVLSTAKNKGPIDYYITRRINKGGRSGNPIAQLVHDWGIACLATQKTIPSWVFQLPDRQIALFLRVFIDCDGWISAREEATSSVNVTLANPKLVQQIGQLALRLGITGTYTHRDNGHAGAWTWSTLQVDAWQERVGALVKSEKLACAVGAKEKQQQVATKEWTAWRRARPAADQRFTDCPQGYEWRKVVSIRRITTPTVNIQVHSDNHGFVGYAVEHNSVCINTIIASILTQATPEDTRLLMVDPKMVELNVYNGVPHLNFPVVTEVEKVVPLLKNAITEMERRYRLFSQLGVRNLDGYRKLRAERAAKGDSSLKNLPAIVIIIDELADLMMAAPEEVEGMICRLAQLARATGIHLVIATQRPSVDVITGLIKANIPTRISFMVSSAVDSRTIIDMGGAERLLGRGDMLYLPADAGRPERIQGAFLADEEVERLVNFWRQQTQAHTVGQNVVAGAQNAVAQPPVEPGWEIQEQNSDDFELEDDLLERAEEVVREYGRASISLLQRRLRIGYSRAARLIDLLEEHGIIGSFEANGRPREILDNGNGNGNGNDGFGNGRSMADEVADIIAEEKAREDFLKKQQDNS